MHVHVNGTLVPEAEALISVFDHGFLYGDGVYETMRVYGGVVFLLQQHLMRLMNSASLIGLDLEDNLPLFAPQAYETIEANSLKEAYLRLTVSRGKGPLGLDPALCPAPTVVIMAMPFNKYPASFYSKGLKAAIVRTRKNLSTALNPQIKSLNFLNNVLAKAEAVQLGVNEALLLNSRGRLTEGTVSNLFFAKDGVLCTPSLKSGILDGITRSTVLQLAKKEGLKVKQGSFTPKDLYQAEEVFLTNTTMEVVPVSQVDETRFPVGPVARLLRKAYRREVKDYIKKWHERQYRD